MAGSNLQKSDRAISILALDGAVTVTWLREWPESALLTVRGKDHDMNAADVRGLATALAELAAAMDALVLPKGDETP